MRRVRYGSLDAVVCGGTDGNGGGSGPLVILLHGFGAPGDDLVVFSEILEVPPLTRFVFPAAPLALGGPYGDGRAWWLIDLERLDRELASGRHADRSQELPDRLPAVRAAMLELIDACVTELDAADSPLVLGGFSQGAMVSCDVALHLERPPTALVLLSGTLIARPVWEPLLPRLAGVPVFQSHGRGDPLLGFAAAERLRDLLAGAGAKLEWQPFSGGHEIPQRVCARLGAFLAQLPRGA